MGEIALVNWKLLLLPMVANFEIFTALRALQKLQFKLIKFMVEVGWLVFTAKKLLRTRITAPPSVQTEFWDIFFCTIGYTLYISTSILCDQKGPFRAVPSALPPLTISHIDSFIRESVFVSLFVSQTVPSFCLKNEIRYKSDWSILANI